MGYGMKYAFDGRNQGLLSVSSNLRGTQVSVGVRDDGIGLPEGFNYMKYQGFGFILIQGLASQMKATLSLERQGGTGIYIDFEL